MQITLTVDSETKEATVKVGDMTVVCKDFSFYSYCCSEDGEKEFNISWSETEQEIGDVEMYTMRRVCGSEIVKDTKTESLQRVISKFLKK